MQRWQERKYLAAVAAARNKAPPSSARRLAVQAATWLGLALALFGVFMYFGMPDPDAWPWLAGAFVLGVFTGVMGLRDASREQWPVLRPHINFESVESRRAELEK